MSPDAFRNLIIFGRKPGSCVSLLKAIKKHKKPFYLFTCMSQMQNNCSLSRARHVLTQLNVGIFNVLQNPMVEPVERLMVGIHKNVYNKTSKRDLLSKRIACPEAFEYDVRSMSIHGVGQLSVQVSSDLILIK